MAENGESRKTYKFTSAKHGQNTELVDMGDGRVAAQGQEIELTEAEADALRATVNLRVASDSDEVSSDSAEVSPEESARDNLGVERGRSTR